MKYLNIAADDKYICEHEGTKRSVSVQLKDINNVSYEYGHAFRFPTIAFLVGIAIIILGVLFGVWPIIKAIIYSDNVGFLYLKGYGLISLSVFLGFWTVLESVKKSHLLLIETVTGTIRLKIRGKIDKNELNGFVNDLNNKLEKQ